MVRWKIRLIKVVKRLEKSIVITVKDFLLQHILECGQCFRFYKEGECYILIAKGRVLKASQEGNQLTLFCTEEVFNTFWHNYLDLDRNYEVIKKCLSEKDEFLKTAVADKYGIRLLRQEPWEMLISFIISQTKQIPQIKHLIEVLANEYGALISAEGIRSFYSFPTPQQLEIATIEDLRALKVGFRAPYIWDATQKVANGEIDLSALEELPYQEARKVLMSIKGVGQKVADCVLLFAYGKYEVFPTDVWVKRVMEHYYFGKDTKMDVINTFARDYFGAYAGFAQQYLFYHARDNKIGK